MIPPVVAPSESLMVQAEQVEQCGVQIVNGTAVLDGVVAVVVGFAVAEPRLHAATSEPHREALRMTIAARLRLANLHRRCAAEFSAPKDKHVVQEPPLFQIAVGCSRRSFCCSLEF